MTYSSLTTGVDGLVTAAVSALGGAGYSYNPKTTSFSAFLATALTGIGGSQVSNLNLSIPQLLAGIVNAAGVATVSHLTTSVDDLLALIANGIGPSIQLSNSTIADTASIGDTVGTLSVLGGTGTYTFTFTSNPGSLFSITGSTLKVAAALTAGSDAITIKADNGAGSVVTRAFLITVTHSAGATNYTSTYISQGIY